MPTLRRLIDTLGDRLTLVFPSPPDLPDLEVSGVHVSELADPTPYLSGGELLLTTGMGLPGQVAPMRAYAARLAGRGLAALAFGPGPVHAELPPGLVAGCEAVGLTLFAVPRPTPFLAVSRAYWGLLTEEGRAELSATVGAHRDLARAAVTRDPVSAVVRVLAESVNGWAARLGPDGEVREAWPQGMRRATRSLRAEVERIRAAGPHASATFPLGGHDVVVHPLTRAGRLVGYVAVGCERPGSPADRGLILTASTVLSAVLAQGLNDAAVRRTVRSCVSHLAVTGHPGAARELAARTGQGALPAAPAVAVVTSFEPLPPDEVADRVLAEDDGAWVAMESDRLVVLTSPERLGRVAQLARRGAETRAISVSTARAASLEQVPGAVAVALAGTSGGPDAAAAAERLAALAAYRRAPLVPAVAAYLRHRGSWEAASRELAVHRNTLRARIGTAERVCGASLDDPDVAAHLWLGLRAAGLT